ncbi:uncharacterized protein LOC142221407 [Haematobia irritans]|uniref:uncharacterized protein LOC142221407 n=1 Tax=Haematobia irritans TaxID=7368 RepID=UPI003F505AEB
MQQHQHNGAPPRRGRCQLCSKNHLLKRCPEFRWMLPKERYEVAKNLNVCLNCLTDWHQLDDCHSSNRCSVCSRLHHTMFHHEDVHVNSPPGLKRFSAKLQQMISDGTLAKLYELISGNQEVQITPASQNPIAIRKVMAVQKAKDVREVATAPISKLRRFTMENKPAIHPHGTDCQVILPVVLCELAAGDQKISLTLAINPGVRHSHVLFESVEHLHFRSKWVKHLPLGVFQIITKKKTWWQDLVFVDKLQVEIPPPVEDEMLPFLLETNGVTRDMWAHPMPHDFGPIHGIIGRDLVHKVIDDSAARLDNYPFIKVQHSLFGAVISGCICNPSSVRARSMLNSHSTVV